jgi:hypothetical protein
MKKKKEVKEKKIVFNTELVEHYTEQIHDGVILKRFQNPWLKGEIGLRRAGVVFQMSKEEQEEYIKCALDIHYFTEKYCKVKTEDGSVNNIRLRGYQKSVLDDFVGKRFNILCASRQVGKCITLTTNVLCSSNSTDNLTEEYEIPLYRILFKKKIKKTIYDYIKYGLYSIIYRLEKLK